MVMRDSTEFTQPKLGGPRVGVDWSDVDVLNAAISHLTMIRNELARMGAEHEWPTLHFTVSLGIGSPTLTCLAT